MKEEHLRDNLTSFRLVFVAGDSEIDQRNGRPTMRLIAALYAAPRRSQARRTDYGIFDPRILNARSAAAATEPIPVAFQSGSQNSFPRWDAARHLDRVVDDSIEVDLSTHP